MTCLEVRVDNDRGLASITAVLKVLVRSDEVKVLGQPALEVITIARFRPSFLPRIIRDTALHCAVLKTSRTVGVICIPFRVSCLLVPIPTMAPLCPSAPTPFLAIAVMVAPDDDYALLSRPH